MSDPPLREHLQGPNESHQSKGPQCNTMHSHRSQWTHGPAGHLEKPVLIEPFARSSRTRSGTRRHGRPAPAVLQRSQRNDGTLGESIKAYRGKCRAGSQEKQRAECGFRVLFFGDFLLGPQKKVTRLPGRIPGGLPRVTNHPQAKRPTPKPNTYNNSIPSSSRSQVRRTVETKSSKNGLSASPFGTTACSSLHNPGAANRLAST